MPLQMELFDIPARRTREIYHCWTCDIGEEMAARLFEKRHGYPPNEVVRDKYLIRCGPVRHRAYAEDYRAAQEVIAREYKPMRGKGW